MKKLLYKINLVENRLLNWAEINSHSFLRVTIGMVYIFYGGLKFFPSHSPAEQLAVSTIEKLSLGLLSGTPAQISLAVMETMLGFCLVFRYRLRWTIYASIGHMMGTFLPVFFFPEVVFTGAPLSLSLVGQYILKNLIIVGALFVLYSKTGNKQSKLIFIHTSREQAGFSDFARDKTFKKQPSHMRARKVSNR